MKQKFKAGMWVYFPVIAGRLAYQLVDNPNDSCHSLRIDLGGDLYYTFMSNGKQRGNHHHPSIFHATEENRILLTQLYGDEFEAAPPTPLEIIQAIIKRDGHCWCGVSESSENHARDDGESYLSKVTSISDSNRFHTTGYTWDYAVPYNLVTCQEITELPS